MLWETTHPSQDQSQFTDAKMADKKTPGWNLRSRMSNLLRKKTGSDVEFLVGAPPQRFPCHKVILAAGSEVFEAMFYGTFEQNQPVRVPDIAPKGFALMLQYLYSDTVALQDDTDAFETAYCAKKYIIDSLFNVCESFLLEHLTLDPEKVLEVHEESTFLGMKKLRGRCLRYVSRHAREVLTSKSLARASRGTFEDVLSLRHMDIDSEKEIVEALWLWGEEQCAGRGVECCAENVRLCTGALLKHVRFFAMTPEELASVLERRQILDTSDELALLLSFAMPRTSKKSSEALPQGICTESKTRSIANKIQFPGQYRYDGNMTSFLIESQQIVNEITVMGDPITVIGVVIAFKAIPCYSRSDRTLEVEVSAVNSSTRVRSGAKKRFGSCEDTEEVIQPLLLEDYVLLEEQQTMALTVSVSGRGIRLMHCTDEALCHDLEKSKVRLKFHPGEQDNVKQLMPIKELMIV